MTAAAAEKVAPGRRALVQDMRIRIDRRHMQTGDGFRGGVVLHEVPSVDHRRADALACDFRNRGDGLIGYEIKVARGDWLQELDHPEKAEAWARYCNEWYVIAPPGVVLREDLPDGWGLLEPVAKVRVTVKVKAARREPEPMPAPVAFELIKKVDTLRVQEVAEAVRAQRQRVYELETKVGETHRAADQDVRQASGLREVARRLGVHPDHLMGWGANRGGSPEDLALAAALEGLPAVLRTREHAARDLRQIEESARKLVAAAAAGAEGIPQRRNPF